MLLMSAPNSIFNVDEMRRTIESLPPDVYQRHDYYERWLMTIERLLVEKGALKQAEIDARVAELEKQGD